MLKKIDKNTGFSASEGKLINLAGNIFLGLWSYASIYSDGGYSKNKTDKEVCDLLVVFGDNVIIFSDKSIKFNEDKGIDIAWKRWFRGSVVDSSRQLYGARKSIRENPHRIYIDKNCKVKSPVKINKASRFHLATVTDNISAPAKKYFDLLSKGSPVTLVNAFIYDAKECLNSVFCMGDLYPNKTFIHVLDELSLTLLLTELNTATNFMEYLIAKERAVGEQRLAISLGEEEILVSYLLGNKKIISDDILKEQRLVSIPKDRWVHYTKSFQYQHAIAIKKGSIFQDDPVENCSKSILATSVNFFRDQPFSMRKAVIRKVAKESRSSRYYLSKLFKEKTDSVPSHIVSSMLVESPDESRKFYLLFLVSQKDETDYLAYREHRIALVSMYFPIVSARHRRIKRIITIAAEPRNSNGRSEDITYIHSPKPMPGEERAEILKATRDINVMSDFVPWRQSVTIKHYTPPHPSMQELGRSEPCYCDSRKKYEKYRG